MSAAEPYVVVEPRAAETPLLVSIPHTGTELPDEVARRLASEEVARLPDTDWHLHRLYDFVPELGARTIHARYSRYLVDLNRSPDGTPLYPGRAETALCPTESFAGRPLWRDGGPSPAEIAERVERWFRPYHARLASELDRLVDRFGYALLWDAHSIASEVPRLVPGRLPGFMLGDALGGSAAPELSRAVLASLAASGIETTHNEPFQGGFITRHFGRPQQRVHALQLEMSQRLYMQEGPPFAWHESLATRLRPVLRGALEALLAAGRRREAPR
jgi:N-formylglutamate deformylase